MANLIKTPYAAQNKSTDAIMRQYLIVEIPLPVAIDNPVLSRAYI